MLRILCFSLAKWFLFYSQLHVFSLWDCVSSYFCMTKYSKIIASDNNKHSLSQSFRSGSVRSCLPRVSPEVVVKMLTIQDAITQRHTWGRRVGFQQGSPLCLTCQRWLLAGGLITHHTDISVGVVKVFMPWELVSFKERDSWDQGRSYIFHELASEATLFYYQVSCIRWTWGRLIRVWIPKGNHWGFS